MDRHRHSSLFMVLLIATLLSGVHAAYGQLRIVGSISGTVQDPNGAVVPNAKVVLKDQTTGLTKESTTSDGGTFLFPDLANGTYSVTVSVTGFKTELIPNVAVTTSKTTDVRITLEVGQTNETVTVTTDTGYVLETSGQLIVNTLNSKAVNELPLGSRSNTLALARLAQGAQPPTGGDTRYNNLPGGAVNVTVDGINNASNGFKSGGTVFFVTVPVRTGAVDEISVETGGMTAESGAQSGANIKFTTKRGGEKYHGSFFYEPQSERFNSNTWSRNAQNLPRLFNRTQNYGGNAGGPLIPFGDWKKKAFFFINYERAYSPVRTARTITVLTADAQKGNFTYLVSGTTNQLRTVNIFTLAAAKGLPTTIDPVAQSIINVNNKIPLQAQKISSGNDFNHDTYTWPAENNNFAYFPAARFDVFVTKKQQFTWTWNYRHNWQAGEKRMPVDEISRTNPFRLGYFIWSAALQSTFSPRVFNEIRYGVQHSGDSNASDAYPNYYTVNGVPLRIGATLPFGPTVPMIDQANVTGRHTIDTLYDTLTWTRGEHTFTFGGSYRNTAWNDTAVIFAVPTYATGTPSGDPLNASSAFTTTTLPGINSTELGNPLSLYNTLTGRVASSSFTKVVNPQTFAYDGGNSINYTFTASHMGGAYVQDKWRFSKDLTLQFGLRWEVQGAMHDTKGLTAVPDLASIYGPSKGLFSPGVMSGNNNPQLQVGVTPYKTDWKNFAPNVGFAWNPNFEKGWLNKLTGGQKTVIRGYYGLVVYDEGTQFFAANLGPNIGKTINGTTLVPGQPGQTNLPAFYTLSNIVANPLTASSFAFATSTYAKTINQADQTIARTISGFDPTLRAPYTINWDFGVQRELWRNTVVEARYVGNQGHLLWRTSNLNEVNIFENGFLQEFKNAQNNFAINQAAGVNSFQNLGRPGQVNLPIFDAAFLARGALGPIASGSGYQSSAFITDLQNGAAGDLANQLATNQNYVCRMFGNTFSPCTRVQPAANAPGPYPINFFLLNPFVAGRLNFTDDTGWSSYNGLQVQFRQRLANGFNWSANWTWSKSMTNLPVDNQNQSVDFLTLRNFDTTRRESLFDIRHTIQVSGTYDLPFGRGKLLSFDNRVLNGVFGGWTLGSIFVFNTGQPIQLTGGFATVNQSNNPGAGFVTNPATGGVQLAPGVTLKQIQKMFNNAKLVPLSSLGRAGASPTQFLAVDPQLIGPDGRANPAFISPNRVPGSFGQILFIRDRNTFTLDNSITKEFRIMERMRLQLFAGFSNILNHPRWGIPDTNVFSTTFGVVNGPGYVSTAGGVGNYGRVMNLRATAIF
jgi:hypothetical protein